MHAILSDKRLWILVIALIMIRIPTLDRPLSRHHEFNNAVILINAESWNQAGGGADFHFTPLMNYQGKANKMLEEGYHIDADGNHVYLSFGAGWYLLPYAFFKAFQLEPTPLSLEILNLVIGLLTIVGLYVLLFKISANRNQAFWGTFLFAILPATLWYGGNGYISTAIMLPVVLIILYCWHCFETNRHKINFAHLITLSIAGIALTYFDWLSVFLFAAMFGWSVWRARHDNRYWLISLTALLTAIIGIWFVLYQFASYLGWSQVLHYWQARFFERSTDTSEFSFTMMIVMCIKNLVTGYFPLFLILPFMWKLTSIKLTKQVVKWPLFALAAIVPYNGVFLNWSAVHEFAWIAFSLIAAIVITLYLIPQTQSKRMVKMMLVLGFCSLSFYFVTNLPGPKNIRGERYDMQMQLGKWIGDNIDSDIHIFTNINNDKIVEYYSKRTFRQANNLQEAKVIMQAFGVKRAVFLEISKESKVESLTRIFPPEIKND